MPSKLPSEAEFASAISEIESQYGIRFRRLEDNTVHHIGEGAYGRVYRVFHAKDPSASFIVKIQRSHSTTLSRYNYMRKAFRMTLGKMDKSYNRYITDDTLVQNRQKTLIFHFMEHLDGQDVLAYLASHGSRITWREIMTIACHTLRALLFFHASGSCSMI